MLRAALCFFALGSARMDALDSFEGDAAGWSADGGTITVTQRHWKLGTKALRWNFGPGDVLVRAGDRALEAALESRGGGVKVWFYCEEPIPGRLRFQAGTWAFNLDLGFTGWRAAWVLFQEDAERADPVQGLRIRAPESGGTLYLDAVELGDVPWFRQGDAQTPYTNAGRAGGRYWMTTQDWAEETVPAPGPGPSEAERAAFRRIEQRYEQWMFGSLDDVREPVRQRLDGVRAYIRNGQKSLEKLGLERRGTVVHGPGAFSGNDRHHPWLTGEIFQPVALPLAYDARLNDNDGARQRFLDLADYAHDQGWASGSLMGSSYGGQLRISSYVHAVYILRDFLEVEGRLARELETLRYHLTLGEIYREPEHPGANADDLRTRLLFRLLYVLMLEDSPEKLRDMRCFVRWADSALSIAPGYGDTIKPDGTVFHHATAYASAYGNNAMLMAAIVYWLLDDTAFALSPETGENIKQALLTLRFMAGKYHVPMGVSGRWPFSGPALVDTCPALAYMATALEDRQLGRAFARLWDPQAPGFGRFFSSCSARIYWSTSPGSLSWLLDVADMYKSEPDPQGHRAYPYAAMSVHRRRQWVASVRGWSRYVWNYESHTTENRYGRYSSYGMLQILASGSPVSPAASGYAEDGWDWLRPPGATVIRTTLDDLHASKVVSRQYTNESFVGGIALGGSDGIWAMRFADPYYETSCRFRKTVFFVGETILCLGSDISNDDVGHRTETTLYQTVLPERPDTFPRRKAETVRWLMDPVGNGYCFPAEQPVELCRQRQRSMHNSGMKATAGNVAVAWIDHGVAPRGAGYAYAIRPDTTPEAMARYAEGPDFELLRRDGPAHVVRFAEPGITGYVLFEATDDLPEGVLSGVDAPCLVMARRKEGYLDLAICDPDLRLPKKSPQTRYGPGETGTLRVQLEEGWNMVAAPANVRAVDNRALEISCRDGATYELRFERKR